MVSLSSNGRLNFIEDDSDVTHLRNNCYSAADPVENYNSAVTPKFKMQFKAVVNSVRRQEGSAILFNISTKVVSIIFRRLCLIGKLENNS